MDDGTTWYEDTTYCDGSDATVISDMKCSIPMSILRSSTYGLDYGDSVVAKVKAHNDRGWSSFSASATTVATIQTEPTTMSAPSSGSSTSSSQIEVTWTALTTAAETGGASITSYHLQWDAGTNTTWSDVVGLSPSYTSTSVILSTSIVSGNTYYFRVRAKNAQGWGSYSSTSSIKAA